MAAGVRLRHVGCVCRVFVSGTMSMEAEILSIAHRHRRRRATAAALVALRQGARAT